MVLAMSEEQLKAAETETTAQVEEIVDEISEDGLEGVAGGTINGYHTNMGCYHAGGSNAGGSDF